MELLVRAHQNTREYEQAIAVLLELVKIAPGREREIYSRVAELKTRFPGRSSEGLERPRVEQPEG